MARRSETGDWRSQTQFESRPGGPIPNTEHGQPPNGIAETARGAVGSETGDWRSQTQFESRPGGPIPNTGHGQPPSGIARGVP
jgi:hypothetical protein